MTGAVLALALAAQSPGAVQAFLDTARAATAQYRDRGAAIADGYRAIGPDTPGMGQHWVSPQLLVAGALDPAHPQVLEYAEVGGRPTLVGITFAVPVSPGEPLPTRPVGAAAWHTHAGFADEESLPLHHGMHENSAPAVAVLHAWVWVANPAGVFATQNWALPFARLGLPVPAPLDSSAAKALSLVTGGEAFYRTALDDVLEPDSADGAVIAATLAAARRGVTTWLAARAAAAPLDAGDQAALATLWQQVWRQLGATLGPRARARLETTGSL